MDHSKQRLRDKKRGGSGKQSWIVLSVVILLSSFANHAGAEEHETKRYTLSIPASDMDLALIALARETGKSLVIPSEGIAGKRSKALDGSYTLSEALSIMLESANLTGGLTESGVITISQKNGEGLNREEEVNSGKLKTGLLAGVSAFLFGAGGAAAQDAGAEDAAENPVLASSTIVVTARRRAESLQDVPVSLEVVTGEYLAETNSNTLIDLASLNPALRVVEGGRNTELFIRGTGSGESQAFEQSVATVIDDVYHGRSRSIIGPFFDVQRIEILKGPQTTYFGANAIAGALNIVTKKPSNEFEGYIRGLISPKSGETRGENGGQYAIEGAVNAPLSDDLALRIAATHNGHDGYFFDVVSGETGPKDERTAVRATLRYNPDDRLDVTLKGEWSKADMNAGLATVYEPCPPDPAFGPGGAGFFCGLALGTGAPVGIENHQFAVTPGSFRRLDKYEAALNIDYDLGFATLTSTTGYYEFDLDLEIDTDILAPNLFSVGAPEQSSQFSQELRLTSETGGAIEYIAGLYFQNEDMSTQQPARFNFLDSVIAGIPPLTPLVPLLPLGQVITADQTTNTYSAFAAVTWNAMDDFRVTGSLRGSIVDKEFDWSLYYGTAAEPFGEIVRDDALNFAALILALEGTPGMLSLDRNDKGLMPGVRLEYDAFDDAMVYFAFTRGFKAGGFNVAETSAIPANFGFNPEFVNAYEVGLKSQFFDRRVRVNLALFRNDFSDLQVSFSDPGGGGFNNVISNAAQSRSQGLELEAEWAVNEFFRLSTAFTALDSEYVSYEGANPTEAQQLAGLTTQDLSGVRTPNAPEFSGNVTGTFTVPVFGDFELVGQGIGIFSTEYNIRSTIDPLTVQPGYMRVDARITFRPEDGPWAFDVIGKNLNNQTIRIWTTTGATTEGVFVMNRVPYRNIAFQLRYDF